MHKIPVVVAGGGFVINKKGKVLLFTETESGICQREKWTRENP